MSDYYLEVTRSAAARKLIKTLGLPLPVPPQLERADGPWRDDPLAGQVVCVGTTVGGTLLEPALGVLTGLGAHPTAAAGFDGSNTGSEISGDARGAAAPSDTAALVFDASGLTSPASLAALHGFFQPRVKQVRASGRVLILARPAEAMDEQPIAAAAARAVEGFVRSLGKELGRRGITVQLLRVAVGAEARLTGPMHYLLSPNSAYVDGQVVTVDNLARSQTEPRLTAPLQNKVALVTGAARGIGAAIAEILVREGARVVCLDMPSSRDALHEAAKRIGGESLALDLTDDSAPATLAERFTADHGGVDIVIHNAGITSDKTLARMSEAQWNGVLAVNLEAVTRIDRALLDGVMRHDGRIVCLSSISGIAGNAGQTNYATSKAGIIGYVQAQARAVAARGVTANAVAPGFIETLMTEAMPMGLRQAGRRMNSLSQGGLPADVAEAVAFLVSPGAVGISGSTLRVCGQSLLGA